MSNGIRRVWEVVRSRVTFIVSYGKRVKVWKNKWCGKSPLCESFLSLFAVADSEQFSAADLTKAESCLARLSWRRVIGDVEDMLLWADTENGKFSIKSLYNTLQHVVCTAFPSKGI